MTGRPVDMFLAGIVEPSKVAYSTQENAASVAAMVLTLTYVIAELIVAEMPEEAEEEAASAS